MVKRLFEELTGLEQVEGIALGGSRSTDTFDSMSDYDVYLYVTAPVPDKARRSILSRYCSRLEIGNDFWELEDNGILNDGIGIDILYRNLEEIDNVIASAVIKHSARNSYTTCIWHNVKTCKIIYDRNGRLAALKNKYDCPYPEELKNAIIDRNMKLLRYGLPAYEGQIIKAVKRGDTVSVNHRVAEFLAAYFDIIFAVNKITHSGEKRLISTCEKNCKILPENFASNINGLFGCMFVSPEKVAQKLDDIITELEKILK